MLALMSTTFPEIRKTTSFYRVEYRHVRLPLAAPFSSQGPEDLWRSESINLSEVDRREE